MHRSGGFCLVEGSVESSHREEGVSSGWSEGFFLGNFRPSLTDPWLAIGVWSFQWTLLLGVLLDRWS